MPFGVSNSYRRGIMKTYARHAQNTRSDVEAVAKDIVERSTVKRIRMDEKGFVITEGETKDLDDDRSRRSTSTLSSIADDTIFSDPAIQDSISPPSSPPQHEPSAANKVRKPAFNFLKRKRTLVDVEDASCEPLAEVSSNARKDKSQPPQQHPDKKTRLTQLQIDLGGEINKSCKTCGMDYIPSNPEDAALHKDFHTMNVGGLDMGKTFVKETTFVKGVGERDGIAMVDSKSTTSLKRKVSKVLEVVRSELGAVEISDQELWRAKPTKTAATAKKGARRKDQEETEEKEDCFKAFLYLEGDKCVGLCLMERIHNANRVVVAQPETASTTTTTTASAKRDNNAILPLIRSSSVSTALSSRDAALLGVSRIWVSKSHRRQGIASSLLDCARGRFFYGIEIAKELVAFSQPTESGGRLAESWFGAQAGWHVYSEQH